mmetsp:Transcript_31214/g.62384  ORF Transcript_31214/g.62384 Transcript_31214/m.62384 type:complete len:406 (+) Transcript_31214:97-1314(+)
MTLNVKENPDLGFEKPDFQRVAKQNKTDIADQYNYDNLVDDHEVIHLKNGVILADNKVIGYDIVRLLRGGVFRVASPTFTKTFVIMQSLLVVAGAAGTLALCLMLERMEHFDIGDGSLLATQTSVTAVHSYFGGFLGFVFGYFVFDSLGACNATKAQLAMFLNGIVSIIYLSHGYCPGADGKDLKIKQTALRWAMATYSMMCYLANDASPEDSATKTLAKGYLTQEEFEVLREVDFKPEAPLVWMIPLYTERLNSPARVDGIENFVLTARAGVGNVLTNVSSFGQPPYVLIVLMSALVKLQLMFQALKSGVDMTIIIFTDTGSKGLQLFFIGMMTFITPIFYQGLLEFAEQISNPFGDDWVDMPTLHMQTGFKEFCTNFVYGRSLQPPYAGRRSSMGAVNQQRGI